MDKLEFRYRGFNCFDIIYDGYLIGSVAPIDGKRWGAQSMQAGVGISAQRREDAALKLAELVGVR